jgi:hypothetical protein
MDDVTKAVKAAIVSKGGAVLTRQGFVKREAQPVDDEGDGQDATAAQLRAAARQSTKDAVAKTLSVPQDNPLAAEHQDAAKAHREADEAHKAAAGASKGFDDVVMHTGASAFHRAQADEHDESAEKCMKA